MAGISESERSAALAGQVCDSTPGSLGKKTAWGFDNSQPTPAGKADVEKKARDYANSRPCITRKATPEELAEIEQKLAKKRCRH